MPGKSAEASSEDRCNTKKSRQYADCGPQRSSISKESNISLEVFGESTPEMKSPRRLQAQNAQAKNSRKADPKDSNGRGSETIGFIPGSAESPQESSACCQSGLFVWGMCKAVFCCVLTCGKYRPEPGTCICVTSSDAPTDVKPYEPNGHISMPVSNSPCDAQSNHSGKKKAPINGNSFNYPDLKLKGVPVYSSNSSSHDPGSCHKEPMPKNKKRNSIEKPPYSNSHRSSDPLSSFLDDDALFYPTDPESSISSAQIDDLIARKLIKDFTTQQIEELAKCTSDTVFLQKTNQISELINSITQDYNLNEQDAECRLVRGIIRISTRKAKSKHPKSDSAYNSISPTQNLDEKLRQLTKGYPPDSGNETMPDSFIISQDDLKVEISEETTSDVIARNLRPGSAPGTLIP
nr:PREDICTED: keratinocyte differentiation factor 1 [Latimeria chalumnae]|eukprot:XP_014341043.1 PREDICTED: keratinocyte differentiation factor 1 [Latimeria chalumnae]